MSEQCIGRGRRGRRGEEDREGERRGRGERGREREGGRDSERERERRVTSLRPPPYCVYTMSICPSTCPVAFHGKITNLSLTIFLEKNAI